MTPGDDDLDDIRELCPGAALMIEAGVRYIFFPGLRLPLGRKPELCDALLCLSGRDGYPTRLFLSVQLTDRGANWRQYRIFDRTWHSWSWNGVPPSLRPAQILAEHMRALQ